MSQETSWICSHRSLPSRSRNLWTVALSRPGCAHTSRPVSWSINDREVSLPFANRDLIDPEALEVGEQVALGLGLGSDPLADPADRPPRDPHQLRHRRLGRVDRQPGGLILEAGVVPGPRDGGDHYPMTLATHARRVGLQVAERRGQIERPPAPASFALVIAGAAPPAVRAPVPLPGLRPDRHHQYLVGLVEIDLLDHRSPQSEQLFPYSEWAHVATAPFTSVPTVRSRNRRSTAACAPLLPGGRALPAPRPRCQTARHGGDCQAAPNPPRAAETPRGQPQPPGAA
jgi:hypothetical protein